MGKECAMGFGQGQFKPLGVIISGYVVWYFRPSSHTVHFFSIVSAAISGENELSPAIFPRTFNCRSSFSSR